MKCASNYKTHYVMHPPSLAQAFVQLLIKQRAAGRGGGGVYLRSLNVTEKQETRYSDTLVNE